MSVKRQPGVDVSLWGALRVIYEAGVAAERERCARITESQAEVDAPSNRGLYIDIAAAIRADNREEDR